MSVRSFLLYGALVAAMSLGGPATAHAQDDAPVVESEFAGQTLRIATKPLEPFVFIDDQPLRGFSVDYWNEIAARLGTESEWVTYDTVAAILDAAEAGEVDAAIAGISITSERESVIDFSQPYYNSGLQIVSDSSSSSGTMQALLSLVGSGTFLTPLLILMVLIFIVSHLVWLFERGHDSDDFPYEYRRGIGEAIWWSTVSVITGGEAVKDINRVLSRIIAIFWMLIGLFLLAFVTARATSVLTVNELTSDISGVEDLAGKNVSTVQATAAVAFLADEGGILAREFPTLEAALDELAAGDTDAVVFDAPVVAYALNNQYRGTNLQLVEPLLNLDPYGIALPQGSPLLEPLNLAVIDIGRDGTLDDLLTNWFG